MFDRRKYRVLKNHERRGGERRCWGDLGKRRPEGWLEVRGFGKMRWQ